MTSFGDDYNQLENCGVDFDSTCYEADEYWPENAIGFEELGECEEDDEKCISRYRLQRKEDAYSQNGKNVLNSPSKSEKQYVGSSHSVSSRPKTATLNLTPLPTPPPLFEGLSKNYYKKIFKPDYPKDLQMKQVCVSKTIRRRTLGNTRTQPKAVFIPSRTTLDSPDQSSLPASPSHVRKSVAISGMKTSFPISETGQRIHIIDEPSPLEQNRLPPPVVSSSDEIIIDWLENHNVQMMFEYFLALCVINQPDNPWLFISNLCTKMIDARTDLTTFDNLPRVLTPQHSEAIFRIYDRIENGFISVSQYKSAMDAMGLSNYSANPEGWEENVISKDTFIKEATEAIDDLLRTFMVFEATISEEQNEQPVDIKIISQGEVNEKRASYYSTSGSSTSGSYSRSGTGSDNADKDNADAAISFDQPQLQY